MTAQPNPTPEVPQMHPDELAGQLRDIILDHVQKMRTTWAQLPNAEQKAYIKSASEAAVDIIDKCLDCILVEGGSVVIDGVANDVVMKKESYQTVVRVLYDAENSDFMKNVKHSPIRIAIAPGRDKVRALGSEPKADEDQPMMFDDDDDVMRGEVDGPLQIAEDKPKKSRKRTTSTGKPLALA